MASSALAGLLLLEAGAQAYLRFVLTPRHDALWAASSLPAASYENAEFHDEQKRVQLIPVPGRPYLSVADLRGRHMNIRNGSRRTTGQPAQPSRRILMFGGSTMLSAEVPDAHTIPSHLQRMVNQSCAEPVAVVNYGVNSMYTAQHAARLEDTPIQTRDLVVFYTGVNQIYYGLYAERPMTDPQPPRLDLLLGRAAPFTAMAGLVADVRARAVPNTVADRARLHRGLSRTERQYEAEVIRAARRASARGADFVNFLQPQLYATPLASAYRRALARNYLITPPGLDIAYREGYPRLRRSLSGAAAIVPSFDISGVLAADRVAGEVFLDFAHVNHIGNARVASAMFDRIAPRLGCRPPASRPARVVHSSG